MAKTTGLASIAEGRSDIHKINPRLLHTKEGWNSRDFNDPDNIAHIEMLAASIAEIGVQEPLTVYWEDGKAYIENGECRLRATMRAIEVLKADIKTIPVKTSILNRAANEADRVFSQIAMNSGKPFSILEQAKVFKKLIQLGWQQTEIAKKAGMSDARVSQILDYNSISEGVKQMIHQGQVAPSTAMAVVKAEGTQAEKVLKQGLEVAKAEGKIKVMAKHVNEPVINANAVPKMNVRTAIIDAFEFSDVNDDDDEIVVIKMPSAKWEVLRKLLAL